MKNLSRFSSSSLIKKYCLALTLVLIALLVYAFFSGSINKNNYQLAGVYGEHTLKYQLTLTVNQPKEEEIALQADDEALVSMEMFEFLSLIKWRLCHRQNPIKECVLKLSQLIGK